MRKVSWSERIVFKMDQENISVCVCVCVCAFIISFTINDVFISVCIIWMCVLIKRQVHMCA